MLAYWVLVGFLFFAALFFKNSKISGRSAKKVFLVFAFLSLVLVAGLRSEVVGTDTSHYAGLFKDVVKMDSWKDIKDSRYELGFVILLKAISLVSSRPSVMIFITSAIVVCLYSRYIIKSSSDVYISLVLFVLFGFYTNTFNIMRQHIAVGICLNAMLLLKNQNSGKLKSNLLFFLYVVLASQFHATAWVFLIVMLSPVSKKYPVVVVFECMVAIVLFTFKDEIATALSSQFGYEAYLISYAERASYLEIVVYSILFVLIFLFMSVIEKRREFFDSIKLEFDVLCVALVVMLITLSEYGLIVRLAYYFKPVLLVILPAILQALRKKDRTVAKLMVYAVGCLYFGWSLYVNNGGIVPYISVFS